jgi:MFS transporter, BCD family, chlorophyll transporter
MPFADIATAELPLSRFLRLSCSSSRWAWRRRCSYGTLNRVMIVELAMPSASLVAVMIAIPLLIAPIPRADRLPVRTRIGVLGWRRVPFISSGTMMQFGGLAIMPFALLVLSGDQTAGAAWAGYVGSALAFFLVGAGAHTVQTAGLALATDLARGSKRPRVVALMYVMMLLGAVIAAFVLGARCGTSRPCGSSGHPGGGGLHGVSQPCRAVEAGSARARRPVRG